MSFFSEILGPKKKEVSLADLRATHYDATTNEDLKEYWRWTDNKSVDASLDPATREKLRKRARYEVANNSYALGCALAIADAVIGSGPRLQVLGVSSKELTKEIEWHFCEWSERINLAEKLRSMRIAKFQDGESFAVLYSNPRGDDLPSLDIMPIDAERVAGDYGTDDKTIDGIQLDEYGNPVSYRILTNHPGSLSSDFWGPNVATAETTAKVYPASSVIHWYRRTFPEQHRGCPEIAAALNLFALLRRYTIAVVAAAETAADIAAFLTVEPDTGSYDRIVPAAMEGLDIRRNQIMTLPEGTNIQQLRAEQPTTTYGDFKRELLGEIGRSLQIPVNLICGNSSGYNYASGRLDHQEFQKAIRLQYNIFAIIQTRISTSTKNTGYTSLLLAKSTGCSHQIAMHLYILRGEELAQNLFHGRHLSWCTATTIEINPHIGKQRSLQHSRIDKLRTWECR